MSSEHNFAIFSGAVKLWILFHIELRKSWPKSWMFRNCIYAKIGGGMIKSVKRRHPQCRKWRNLNANLRFFKTSSPNTQNKCELTASSSESPLIVLLICHHNRYTLSTPNEKKKSERKTLYKTAAPSNRQTVLRKYDEKFQRIGVKELWNVCRLFILW